MVEIENLKFGYHSRTPLFQNIHLTLSKGHIYGLLGKNGAGKSTLLKNIAGLITPTDGMCRINGLVSNTRTADVLEEYFFLSEDVYVPSLTPVQYVRNTGIFYPKFSEEDFYKFLEILDVDKYARLDRLSFGQQKKAMIAFGLAANTSLVILDEPTNGLDIPSKAQFRKLIASVLREDRTIIISTHQVRDLDNLIDSILVLHESKIVLKSSMDNISSKLSFPKSSAYVASTVLYEENSLAGTQVITRNESDNNDKVDLELLFNALTSGNKIIIDILNTSHE